MSKRFLITETIQYYLDMPEGSTAEQAEQAFCNMSMRQIRELQPGDLTRTVEEAD